MIKVFSVCYCDKHFENSSPENQHFIWQQKDKVFQILKHLLYPPDLPGMIYHTREIGKIIIDFAIKFCYQFWNNVRQYFISKNSSLIYNRYFHCAGMSCFCFILYVLRRQSFQYSSSTFSLMLRQMFPLPTEMPSWSCKIWSYNDVEWKHPNIYPKTT